MRPLAVFLAVALCSAAAASKEKKSYDSDFLFEDDDWKEKKEKPTVKTWIWDPESGLCSALSCRSTEMCLLEDSFTAVCVSRAELKTNGDRIISRQLAEDEHLIKSEPWSEEEDDDLYDEEEDEDEINLDEDEEEEEEEEEYDYDDEEEDDDEDVDVDEDEDDDEEADREMNKREKKECRECPYSQAGVSSYICGTDNRTYSSLCRLEQHNCVHGTVITTDCKGFCPCKEPDPYQRRKQKPREDASRPRQTYGSLKKPSKARQKSKYDNYLLKERKSYNNVKYYPKNVERESKHQSKCSRSDLESMGARLADWFVVIKSTNGGVKPNYKHHKYYSTHFPSSCRSMAQWMFLYLDTDADSQLTQRELYAVERDEHEPCLKPFLDNCDLNGDIFLTTREWCTCFKSVPSPCQDRRRRQEAARPGAYLPACDEDGFFRPTQCHGSQCWCADRYGVEQKGTRTRRGNTRCDGDTVRYDADFNVADEDDEDNYVIDGSGGGPLLEF